MATLSDRDILTAMLDGAMAISPKPTEIQPASVDLHLSDSFFVQQKGVFIDPGGSPQVSLSNRYSTLPKELSHIQYEAKKLLYIYPGEFILGSTVERVRLGNSLRASVEGKSTLGRYGLIVHATAGFVDPGFNGQITLELYNLAPNPLPLKVGMKICQLAFHQMSSPVARPYGSKELGSRYQNQEGAQPPRV